MKSALAKAALLSFLAGGIQPGYGQTAPVPGSLPESHRTGTPSAYQQLPLSIADAQSRIRDLKVQIPEGRLPSMQESVYQLCEWLADMAEAHNKLANSFAKHESTRQLADTERQTGQKFVHLKYQALLLKSDLLIRQGRYPEALGPLVDIVAAEPHTATGQEAYRKLQEIGFADEVESKPAVKTEIVKPAAKTIVPVSPVKPASPQSVTQAPRVYKSNTKKAAVSTKKVLIAARSSKKKSARWISGSPFGHY